MAEGNDESGPFPKLQLVEKPTEEVKRYEFPLKDRFTIAQQTYELQDPFIGLKMLKFNVVVEQCQRIDPTYKSDGLLEDTSDTTMDLKRLKLAVQIAFGIMGLWEARAPMDMFENRSSVPMTATEQVKIYRRYFIAGLARSR